ncbi:tyrosine--tRNA ligase [Candidatus Woesearchaeota archaeon CG1_02_57_44]|nr:MAG: tyrosine--tRNA ligase [Candidatus Woesearchaeota archaeon CG1_02_57_44]
MDTQSRMDLIRQVGEEILTEDDLKALLDSNEHPIAYDGFEPSGKVHIAQGVMRTITINKMLKAGCKFKMLVADWHAWANNKVGGDLENIQTVGNYLIETWKAAGMDTDKVEFVWANDFMADRDYWKTVMNVARSSTVSRILRCSQIMGRKESDALNASQIFYPCMQAADIFKLDVDICQLGLDQRKVNVLARELAPGLGFTKPVAVHHHMLAGLHEPKGDALEAKMSKSKPDSAIFMTDPVEEVERKLKKAFCPEKLVEQNPVMEYCRYILFERFPTLDIERPEKFGGDISYSSYMELELDYTAGNLHPADLKTAVARQLNELLEPVRKHFASGRPKELLEQVQSFQVTR